MSGLKPYERLFPRRNCVSRRASGRFCYHWESEWHRPWCYVSDDCPGARKEAHRVHRHQSCNTEEGYLGPEGYNPPKGCSCSGLESVHGFGAYCKGWEFAGQKPHCAVNPTHTWQIFDIHQSLDARIIASLLFGR